MTAILYPVAANADLALSRPLARAAREREARGKAGEAVAFTTDAVGPAFPTREAALQAYGDRVDNPLSGTSPAPEDRFCRLAEQVVTAPGVTAPLAPVEPVFEAGRRWPTPPAGRAATAWRLQVSYWRTGSVERPLSAPQARQARKSREPVSAEDLRAMTHQPLRPVEPQRGLDIGLFEVRLPEAPHIVAPDE